ncbi:hypothetical protein NPIL_116051 [Nephila pilipes]|uniref:Uncharacterized protein n=1 Tax=Nephila pilipes TaxID=299642 RepID=A0A8X6U0P1_NEPPI|nr:hypothetical protein NPIL_116051 [Nephila pilipes]
MNPDNSTRQTEGLKENGPPLYGIFFSSQRGEKTCTSKFLRKYLPTHATEVIDRRSDVLVTCNNKICK